MNNLAMTQPVRVLKTLGSVSTSRGSTRIVRTTNPTLGQPPWFYSYVALGEWLLRGGEVALFVTYFTPPGDDRREVNLVYSPVDLRYDAHRDGQFGSVAVQVGKWLFDQGHLTHHSVDRTPAGDRWAKAVGGHLPDLAPDDDPHRGNPEATERSAVRAYNRLCATNWDSCRRSH